MQKAAEKECPEKGQWNWQYMLGILFWFPFIFKYFKYFFQVVCHILGKISTTMCGWIISCYFSFSLGTYKSPREMLTLYLLSSNKFVMYWTERIEVVHISFLVFDFIGICAYSKNKYCGFGKSNFPIQLMVFLKLREREAWVW